MLPHPPAMAFAVPTMFTLNMLPTQYCVETKTPREMPMMRRAAAKPPYVVTMDMRKTAGEMKHKT